MEKEELRARLKEELRKKHPKAKIYDSPEGDIVVEIEKHKGVYFLDKMLGEIEASYPSEWEGIIKKRVEMNLEKQKIIQFVPRSYSKQSFRSPTGKIITKAELEKGGLIILKEMPEDWIILMGETEQAFIGLNRKLLLEEYGFTEETLRQLEAKMKKKLEEMGI
jgi:hypothetical protein